MTAAPTSIIRIAVALLLAALLPISLISSIGCERRHVQVLTERGSHVQRPPARRALQPVTRGEMYIVYGESDSLAAIAANHGVTIEWLIRRNLLTAPVKPGDNLIVPARRASEAAPAP